MIATLYLVGIYIYVCMYVYIYIYIYTFNVLLPFPPNRLFLPLQKGGMPGIEFIYIDVSLVNNLTNTN